MTQYSTSSTLLCWAHQSPLKTVVGKSGRNSGWNLEKAVQCKIIYSQQGYTGKKDLLSLFQREKYKEFLIKTKTCEKKRLSSIFVSILVL